MNVLGQRFEGARVLDLYAGSGALALETLSRGAARATLVENASVALRCIEANVAALGCGDRVEIHRGDALAMLAADNRMYDFVFADPPYASRALMAIALAAAPRLVERGRLTVEHDRREDAPALVGALVRMDDRRYGDTAVAIYGLAADLR